MGDLNVDIKDGDLSNPTWKHIVELHSMQQLIKVPTMVTAHSETLIDHVYASKPENVISPFVPYIALSDHYPTCFKRTTTQQQVKRTSHKTIKYRCYKKFNDENFLQDVSNSMSNLELYQCDLHKNFREWNSAFMQVFNKHAPVKSKRVKRETQPGWYTDNITNATNNRDESHKKKDLHNKRKINAIT